MPYMVQRMGVPSQFRFLSSSYAFESQTSYLVTREEWNSCKQLELSHKAIG